MGIAKPALLRFVYSKNIEVVMTPSNMPLPKIGPAAVGNKPPAPITSASYMENHSSFENSLDKAIADKAVAPKLGTRVNGAEDANANGTEDANVNKKADASIDKGAGASGDKKADASGDKKADASGDKKADANGDEAADVNVDKKASADGDEAANASVDETTHADADKKASADVALSTLDVDLDENSALSEKPETEILAQTKGADRIRHRKESIEGEDPQGLEGIAPLEMRAQIFSKEDQAQRGTPLPTLAEKTAQTTLPTDEMLLRLAAITNPEMYFNHETGLQEGGNLLGSGAEMPQIAAPSVPTLPTSGLAFLTGMLAQARSNNKNSQMASKAPSPVADNGGHFDMGLRSLASPKGGQVALPESGPPLSTQSPAFADELMGRVGRIRIFSRGGASEQVRVTLVPADLGTVDLRLRVDAQSRVHLLITAETDAARDLMMRQMSQLREALERQNMGFGEVTVHVDAGQRGHEEMAQWGFGERADPSEGDVAQNMDEIVQEKERGAAISTSDGRLSIFA